MIHVDFVFPVARDQICAVGWGSADLGASDLVLMCRKQAIAPDHVTTYPREDMSPAIGHGFLCVFAAEPAAVTGVHLKGKTVPLARESLDDGLARLAGEAVNSAFLKVLSALATGQLRPDAADWGAVLVPRLRSFIGGYADTPEMAIGLDLSVSSKALEGGLISGWAVSNTPGSLKIRALGWSDTSLVAVPVRSQALARADLAELSGRYQVSGADGFFARLTGDVVECEAVMFVLEDAQGQLGLASRITPASRSDVATALLKAASRPAPGAGKLTLFPTLPRPVMPVMPQAPLTAARSGPVTLLLQHDCGVRDLRDVLRRVCTTVARPVQVHLVETFLDDGIGDAVSGAIADVPPGHLRMGASVSDGTLPTGVPEEGVVLFGKSSTIVQMQDWGTCLHQMLAENLTAAVCLADPQGLTGDTDCTVAEGVRHLSRGARFVAAIRNAWLTALCPQIRDNLLTVEAQIRAATCEVLCSGAPTLIRKDTAPLILPGWHRSDAARSVASYDTEILSSMYGDLQ